MKITNISKFIPIFITSIALLSVLCLVLPVRAHAQVPAKNDTSQPHLDTTNDQREAIDNCGVGKSPEYAAKECLPKNPIVVWTLIITNFLAAGAGIIIVIMIIVGGIQYAASNSNPQAVQAAKMRITNAVLALLALFFLYAFLQYLLPGGIF